MQSSGFKDIAENSVKRKLHWFSSKTATSYVKADFFNYLYLYHNIQARFSDASLRCLQKTYPGFILIQ